MRPLTAILTKLPESQQGFREAISLHVQPVEEEVSRVWMILALTNFAQAEQELRAFQDRIFLQDKPILENQVPKRLPLDPGAELPVRCDRMSLAYRRVPQGEGVDVRRCQSLMRHEARALLRCTTPLTADRCSASVRRWRYHAPAPGCIEVMSCFSCATPLIAATMDSLRGARFANASVLIDGRAHPQRRSPTAEIDAWIAQDPARRTPARTIDVARLRRCCPGS